MQSDENFVALLGLSTSGCSEEGTLRSSNGHLLVFMPTGFQLPPVVMKIPCNKSSKPCALVSTASKSCCELYGPGESSATCSFLHTLS
jgi:hypothetical protein